MEKVLLWDPEPRPSLPSRAYASTMHCHHSVSCLWWTWVRGAPEKTFPSIGLIVSWLLAVTNGITFQNERVREKEGVSVIDYVLLELLAASMHSFTDSTWTGLLQHTQDVSQRLNFLMDLAVQSVWACSCNCTVRSIKKFRHWETSCGSRSGPVQIK